jgi:hypothetical protein
MISARDSGFLVNFLIGGTQKSGTTALAHFLGQHPEICLPDRKEAHFFDAEDFEEDATDEAWRRVYQASYSAPPNGRVVGDATPIYMYLPEIPGRVRRYNPAMKWILLLRNPVERAVSHYRMEFERGMETLPFESALRQESLRLWQDWRNRHWQSSARCHSYVDRGFYSRQIRWLLRLFNRRQILILTTDQLRDQHEATLRRVYDFLGLREREFIPPAKTVFATQNPEPVSPGALAMLQRAYSKEISTLEQILSCSLDGWRKPLA